jgi:antitoxin VapB
MSLNIKDPEVHRLAKAISEETGESMTQVVREALQERYDKLEKRKGKASVEELEAIAESIRALRKEPFMDHAELLYDEHGLPK